MSEYVCDAFHWVDDELPPEHYNPPPRFGLRPKEQPFGVVTQVTNDGVTVTWYGSIHEWRTMREAT